VPPVRPSTPSSVGRSVGLSAANASAFNSSAAAAEAGDSQTGDWCQKHRQSHEHPTPPSISAWQTEETAPLSVSQAPPFTQQSLYIIDIYDVYRYMYICSHRTIIHNLYIYIYTWNDQCGNVYRLTCVLYIHVYTVHAFTLYRPTYRRLSILTHACFTRFPT